MSEPITLSITMTRDQWETLQNATRAHHDAGYEGRGPNDDTWQSPEMTEVADIIEEAVCSIPETPEARQAKGENQTAIRRDPSQTRHE